jgi:predicted amidohydrolase
LKVAAIQHDIVWEDAQANHERLTPLIATASGAGAELVVLTEMFASGFSMNVSSTAEPRGGPSTQFLVSQAATHGIWLCGSIAEQAAGEAKPHNTLVLAGPDGEIHRYRKIHPFTYSGESEHFGAGNEFVTVDIKGVRTTLFVCYDLRFADEFWATAADTDLYVVVANWPAARRHHWTTLLRARAIENQAYVIGCNRVGAGGDLKYTGDSQIIDPMGDILASASTEEAILYAEVVSDAVRETREKLPFSKDRR